VPVASRAARKLSLGLPCHPLLGGATSVVFSSRQRQEGAGQRAGQSEE